MFNLCIVNCFPQFFFLHMYHKQHIKPVNLAKLKHCNPWRGRSVSDSTSTSASKVISHWWPLSPEPSMQHSEMLNVAGQRGISHTDGPHGHQSSDLHQILSWVCYAPLGLLCTSKGLRTWEKRGRRRDGVTTWVTDRKAWKAASIFGCDEEQFEYLSPEGGPTGLITAEGSFSPPDFKGYYLFIFFLV